MGTPLVSIITPAYNAERFIRETIASVQGQTYSNWEIIVADDGSSDRTADIVGELAASDARIRLVRLQRNTGPATGPARARNAALDLARGDLIAFLDSDDLWLPTKLERQVKLMLDRGAALSYTAYRRIDADGTVSGRLIQVPERVTYSDLLGHNDIACLTVMADRSKTGPLRMTARGYDDYILWLGILRKGFVAYGLREDLARYRVVGKGSVSSSRMRAARWRWEIYREVEKLSLGRSLWYFASYAIQTTTKHLGF